MAVSARSEFMRPLPLMLLAVAVIGWLGAGYYRWRTTSAETSAAARIQQLETKATEAQTTLDKATHDRDATANQLRVAQQEAAAAQTKLTDVQGTLDKALHDRGAALAQVRAAQQDVTRSESKAADLQASLDKALQDRDESRGQLEKSRQQLTETQAKLVAMQQALTSRPAATPAPGATTEAPK